MPRIRAAGEVDAADVLDGQRHGAVGVALHQPPEAIADAEHLRPPRTARIVAAPITLLMPGAGPPPHRMPTRFVLVIGSRITCGPRYDQGDADARGQPGFRRDQRRGGGRGARWRASRRAPDICARTHGHVTRAKQSRRSLRHSPGAPSWKVRQWTSNHTRNEPGPPGLVLASIDVEVP